MISLRDVLDGTAGMLRGSAAPDLLFRRVWHDSRTVEPGDLFVALRGERHDGHDFVADAVRRGAAGALVEARWAEELANLGIPLIVVDDTLAALLRLASYWRRLFAVPVAAVTGSVGKTSTKEAIASVLAQRFQVVRSRASFNTDVGIALDLLTIDPNTDVVVLEFGEAYRLGEVRELCALAEPRIGVVTNVSYAHLARMGTIERIAQSIAELPESLPADGVAVLNGDDFRVRLMAERTPARVLLYGLSPDCHVRAEEIESRGLDGISFELVAFGERNRVRLPGSDRGRLRVGLDAGGDASRFPRSTCSSAPAHGARYQRSHPARRHLQCQPGFLYGGALAPGGNSRAAADRRLR
jgi:UDP-N-acetylmuramoyl-tripeptide--D-alanyl-D-alanine ligase